MPIKNFVDFATDRINPDVFNAYTNSGYIEGDYSGADASTQDYTKLGWMIAVREEMKAKGTNSQDVDALINSMFSLTSTVDGETKENWNTLSKSGYNLAQIIVYNERQKDTFDMSWITDFENLKDIFNKKDGVSRVSASEMTIMYGIPELVDIINISSPENPDLSDRNTFGSMSTENMSSDSFSLYMQALIEMVKVPANEDGSLTKAAQVMSAIETAIDRAYNEDYEAFFFRHERSAGEASNPANEVSRMVTFLRGDRLKDAVRYLMGKMTDAGDEVALVGTSLAQATEGATGISATTASFDPEMYIAGMSSAVKNVGYTPMFYYIGGSRGSSDVEILELLSSEYSIFSIACGPGYNDGFTPAGMLTDSLEVSGSDWSRPEIATFIRSKIGEIPSSDKYVITTSLGGVRDLTGGANQNLFGTYNNIMLKINNAHYAWWQDNKETDGASIAGYEPTITSLLQEILGAEFSSSDYNVWTAEYRKEIE